jgi:two-component system chemotaxis response regulator CheY
MSATAALPAALHVVVVEDNVDANNLLRDWLKPSFKVTSFLDAESTVRRLKPSDEPIVFVIDFNMPGDNGLVLKKKLMPSFPNAKYVLISGLLDDKLAKQAKSAGFDDLLAKPFGMPVISQKIDALFGLSRRENVVDRLRQASQMVNTLI